MDHEALELYPVIKPVDVRWGEMDALGHVNNRFYFRYFEEARIQYFKSIEVEEMLGGDSTSFILASASTDFERPVSHPDTLYFGTRVTDFGKSRFNMDYRAVSEKEDQVIARGECVIVTFDLDRERPIRIPEKLRDHILELQGDLEGVS